jgi:hypothetical protein
MVKLIYDFKPLFLSSSDNFPWRIPFDWKAEKCYTLKIISSMDIPWLTFLRSRNLNTQTAPLSHLISRCIVA